MLQTALEAFCQIFSASLCILPVKARFLACLLLFLKFEGTAVPIIDFLLEARLHFLLDLVDLGDAARLDLCDMLLGELDRGETDGGLFEVGAQPVSLQQILDARNLFGARRAKVQVGCDAGIGCGAVPVDRSELQAL